MPRPKPKAQRLAPPSAESQSDQHPHAHPPTSPTNHTNSYQPVSQREKQGNHLESFRSGEPNLNTSPISRTPKRRERPANSPLTKVLPENNHSQPTVKPNTPNKQRVSEQSPNSVPGTVVDIDPLHGTHPRPSTDALGNTPARPGGSSLSPHMSRPSSPLSCATSDTASVALEDFVPELEEFDDIVLPALAARRNPHSHKHTTRSSPRDLKARLPNGSAQHSSKSRARVSEGSSATKAVEADPTAGRASCTLPEPTIGLRSTARAKQVEKRKKSSFTFVSNDEAKSVFERERGSTDGSGVSAGDADRNKFGDYWKELETVSIRRSMEAKPGARNGGQQRMRQEGSKAPSLDPQNRGSSSRRGSKQSKSKKNGMEIEREEDRHPITEENIDGGDAIGVDVKRKRKAMKRARSTQESLRRSRTKQRSQWHSSNGHDADMVDARNREGEESMKVAGAGIGLQNGLDDGEDTGRSTGFSESDGQACMQCGGHGKASKMVLCDVCSDGCHTFCMRPARASVPLGVWICPRCHTVAKKHRVHLSKLGGFLKSNAVAGE